MAEIKEYFKIALRNLKSRLLRSWLTILGIIIGVFLIISLLSLSEGLKTTINQQLQSLGGEMIMVMPGSSENIFSSLMFGGAKLEREEMEAIRKAEGVDKVIGFSYSGTAVRYEGESKQAAVGGFSPWKEGLDVLSVFQGWSLSEGKWPARNNEILIGSYIAQKTFVEPVKINSEMTIKGRKFKVAGILNSLGNQQDDSMIYMDMEVYQEITGEKRGTAAYAMVLIESGENENTIAERIEDILREATKRKSGTDEDNFAVITSEKMGEIAGTILGIIQVVIIGFASIAILVGGIGIANSMFTSVKERTKEIGIMKAIGAKNSAILWIFMIEAGIIGVLGGIGGLTMGTLLAQAIDYFAKINPAFYFTTTIAPWMVIFALGFSFTIGCLAGFFPAKQAAKLKPVEALRRHE